MKNRKREICTSGSVRDEAGQPPHLLGRRQFLHLATGAATLPAVSRIASAQTYPSRPVRILVGYPPGGAHDIIARVMGQWLAQRLGPSFIIENRPGAATNIATEAAIRAPADGYTLVTVGPANASNATLYELNFNFLRDIAPVSGLILTPNVMEVHPSLPVQTVPALIAYAKANPGKLNFASSGNGGSDHMSGELFKMMTGVDMVHVPYRGAGPALTDLLGGQVQLMFGTIPASIEHVRAGRLRALGVTTLARLVAFPNIPTVSEFVPGYEAIGFVGIGAPANTPVEVINLLNQEINFGLANAMIKARIADLGATPQPGSPADFGKFIADETEKWAKVIRAANIKAE
jgi:tripartite-type tricarboxylate transporter receptor subunit TctC